jgi:hypothetical protein
MASYLTSRNSEGRRKKMTRLMKSKDKVEVRGRMGNRQLEGKMKRMKLKEGMPTFTKAEEHLLLSLKKVDQLIRGV